MTELLVIGTSHKIAPLELRERLALPEAKAAEFLEQLGAAPQIHEAVMLSTCNRMELYVVVGDPVEAEAFVLGRLAKLAGMRPTELVDGIYSLRNCDVARHLYRVTSSLDSLVVGEAEIQGQVKRAYDAALAAGTTGPLTNKLFRAALATGKRVRTETAIAEGRSSVSSVAVDLAEDTVGSLTEKRVLVIGAGETAELTASALHDHGVGSVVVTNRHRERAASLAQRFGGRTVPFDALPDELREADIVISSTAAPHTILGVEEVDAVMEGRHDRPLLLIDLAVPRDVDPDCAGLPGVRVANVDDLTATVERHLQVRGAEAETAEAIVEEEIQGFAVWLGSLEVLPTIAALREHGERIVDEVLEANEARWESLSDRDRARVEALARSIANRLLHEPTVRVKQAGDRRHARMHVLRELFGLDESVVPDAVAEAEREPAEVRELPRRRTG